MVWVLLIVVVVTIILIIVLTSQPSLAGAGKECNRQADCAQGLVCSGGDNGIMTCRQGLGQTCGVNDDCSTGLVCSPTLKVCVAAPAVMVSAQAETRALTAIPGVQPTLITMERNPNPLLSRPPPITLPTPLPALIKEAPLPALIKEVVAKETLLPALIKETPAKETPLPALTVIKEAKSGKTNIAHCKSDASSYIFSAQTGCSRFAVASDASSDDRRLPLPRNEDIPTVLMVPEAKSEGRRIIEIEGLVDACNFSDRIVYIKKNSVFKLSAGMAIDQPMISKPINTHSSAEHIGPLKDMTIIRSFKGNLYVVAQGYLYCLNMRTYSARKWQWIQCSWASPDIDGLSVPYDDSLLWIHTKDDKAFIYDGEKITKLEDSHRRTYGINAETYLSFSEKEMLAYPAKRSFALAKDALLLHDSSIIILQERDSAYRRLCLLDWKAYHIRT